ncbi:MAG: ribosomal protein S18-alanine N-acetyltransferase [Tetrasphaera sp.]
MTPVSQESVAPESDAPTSGALKTGALDAVPPSAGSGGVAAVRALCWPDIPAVAAAEAELFPDDAWSPASWWGELAARPRRDYVIAVDPGGALLGYAGADHGGEVSDLMTIAVTSAARGRGLGRLLLAEIEHRARARGAAALLLEVRADNAAALELYRSSGFDVLSTRRRYYQPGDVDAVVMRKLLADKGGDAT